MIVKILKKSETFKGVNYNTSKVDNAKGELMKVQNFGALQALDHLRPQDYINYLSAQSARNSRIKFPQFHAVISAKGKSHDKDQLTAIAEQWLKGMGYGDQPYLLIFHNDTKNNHLHIVSTRVGKNGRKISDAYEKIKSYKVLNQILGMDENMAAKAQVEKALNYSFSTRAQFMMILEAQGYALTLSSDHYKLCKFGKEITQIPLIKVDERVAAYQNDKERISQLRTIFEKYRLKNDPAIYVLSHSLPGGGAKTLTGYSSKLADVMKEKFGVQILFHSKDNKPPYGYTILDHATKAVFKGGEIMSLKEFITPAHFEANEETILDATFKSEEIVKQQYQNHLDFDKETLSEYPVADRNIEADPPGDFNPSTDSYNEGPVVLPELQIDIADDIDDEAIHGRNRRKKRKARTNTR